MLDSFVRCSMADRARAMADHEPRESHIKATVALLMLSVVDMTLHNKRVVNNAARRLKRLSHSQRVSSIYRSSHECIAI